MADHDTWTIVSTDSDAHALGRFNSIATISNGYLGLKGNVAEQSDGYSPVTLINGVYDKVDSLAQVSAADAHQPHLDPRYFASAAPSPAIGNLPDPLLLRVFVNEHEIALERGTVDGFQQTFNLRTGVYAYSFDYTDDAGRRTRVEQQRFASLRHAHRVFVRYSLTPVDHDARMRIHSGINGTTHSNSTGQRQYAVTGLWAQPAGSCRLGARTPAREHDVYMGVVHSVHGSTYPDHPVGVVERDAVHTRYEFDAQPGVTFTLDRAVVITCSEDVRHGQATNLETELAAADAQGFDAALEEQRAAWDELWRRCDVEIDGDDPAQLGLRFSLHHLIAAAPRFTDRLSVPAQLLTGEYYQGNTFYDADLYVVPLYTFVLPDLARTCLNFRYEGLRPARETARQLGYEGAKPAWQAGPYGEECLGRWWRFTHTSIHIGADIAHAVVQYYQATHDEHFMSNRGVDILVETARFYAARATRNANSDTYDLLAVTGPDDGHCECDNNFHTNYLAARNLRSAAAILDRLAHDDPTTHASALRRLAVRHDEPTHWRQVADKLTLLHDPHTGVYEQFAGFHQLRPPSPKLRAQRHTQHVDVSTCQAINQPDVLMTLALLRDDFTPDVRRANWEHYRDLSLDYSSMSYAINAIMAADAGELDEAYRHFVLAAGLDLDESLTGRGDTHAGLHAAAAGGAWMATVFGLGGVCLSEHGVRIDPHLPSQWNHLRFKLVLRGVVIGVDINHDSVTLTAAEHPGSALELTIYGRPVTLASGQRHTVRHTAPA